MMTQVLEIPDLNVPTQDLKMILAEALLAQGSVSLGKAAQIAGYTVRTFIELMLKKGVSPITFDDEHIEEDIRNA
jgi:predicted HTH domain antitoxin